MLLGTHKLGCILAAALVAASPPAPDTLWQVTPEIDYSDHLYAGWDQIPTVSEVQVYNGVAHKRTYAHHPELFAIGKTAYLIFSSAPGMVCLSNMVRGLFV